MGYITKLVFILLLCTNNHVICSRNITGSLKPRDNSDVTEVACSIFTMLQRCSNLLNGCGHVCDEFSKACECSIGGKFFIATCQNNTLSEIVTFLRKQPVVYNKAIVKWESLAENPLKITDYVMSRVFNGKLFHRYTSRMQHAISSVRTSDKRTVRTGKLNRGRRHKKKQASQDERTIELSCFLFTASKDCSTQFTNCSPVCRKMADICNQLSFYSKFLSLTCKKHTLYDIIALYPNFDDPLKQTSTDVKIFWRDLIDDPVLLMKNIATGASNKGIFATHSEGVKFQNQGGLRNKTDEKKKQQKQKFANNQPENETSNVEQKYQEGLVNNCTDHLVREQIGSSDVNRFNSLVVLGLSIISAVLIFLASH
ncbi:uncharacterized protein LOC126829974 isoform X2 [Patella vulgata]|nr:uncharacterized protein LOC126829974 isoform X2 [Patella vulgata]XP_050416127.1 uncharacterized protein LOC126829974 isoform X2 [Patella vulgata]